MISTVLIANRGEIAVRIARTCRELGLRTVAVYSTADRDSAVLALADEAVQIGPPAASKSYLNMAAIMEAAKRTGADAIHPGYGFLSEDPDFAEVCAAHEIAFVGPSAAVLRRLGDKAQARAVFAELGLPVLPGTSVPVEDTAEARPIADTIGYPVIIKAAAGGGGRGMAIALAPGELDRAYQEAVSHAQSVFGDGRVYLERFLPDSRHVEVQILGDRHGQVVHLGTRDCSVQRRRQKLVEEAPAPELPASLTERLCEAAARAAAALGYEGAGTFEFLVKDGEFYFMEINCRLQVEHPVTELVTGLDLVREQLLVAAGEPLAMRQQDVCPRGASIECRINAEDPARGFTPTPGTLTECVLPGGPFTRLDTHVFPGWTVTTDYDSLLAKLAVWAPDRRQAIARMDRALGECRLSGLRLRTTTEFLREVLAHPRFAAATHGTGLVAAMRAGPADGH